MAAAASASAAESQSKSTSRGPPPVDPSKLRTYEDSEDDEQYYCPEGVEKMDHEVWDKYITQISESEGFDIVDYPGHCAMVTIVPINFHNSPIETQLLTKLSTAAIEDYNKKHRRTKYELEKIVTANANVCGGIMYYITFEAKERKRRRNPVVKTFQAQVWHGIGHVTVDFCRLKKMPIPMPPPAQDEEHSKFGLLPGYLANTLLPELKMLVRMIEDPKLEEEVNSSQPVLKEPLQTLPPAAEKNGDEGGGSSCHVEDTSPNPEAEYHLGKLFDLSLDIKNLISDVGSCVVLYL